MDAKFSIGDRVYHAGTTTVSKQLPCPDCLGKKTWHVRSPAGAVYEAACPRCSAHYISEASVSLDYREFAPAVQQLTIGSVRMDTNEIPPFSYMCVETGVGSGSVYGEDTLFETEAQAIDAATVLAKKQNKTVPWVAEQWKKTVQFCDYELRPVIAKAEKGRNAVLQWEIHDIKEAVRNCATFDEVKAIVETWE